MTPIERLRWQCSRDPRYYVHLKLYPIINKLTIDDWRIIRKGDYWEKRDAISCPFERAGFTLARIEHYQRNYY
jgi:hypothetical protein